MSIPTVSELQRFFDDTTAQEVHRVTVTTSWLSLRILDALYRSGATSAGELARQCNMDMREVRDRLEHLAEAGIVVERDGEWTAVSDEYTISIERDEGITVTLTDTVSEATDPDTVPSKGTDAEPGDDAASHAGRLDRLTNWLSGLFPR